MTKTEELRELRNALDDLIETEATKILTAHQFLELPGFDKIMDAIVAVARAEGVAEGAEEKRLEILKASDTLLDSRGYTEMFGTRTVPASVLAPTKEKP